MSETIPRSYIKSLYDRIDELNSLLSVQDKGDTTTESLNGQISLPDDGHFGHHTIPSRNGQSHYLGPSPPTLSAFSVVSSLVSLDIGLEPPVMLSGTDNIHDLLDLAKVDRSMLSPNIIRVLLAHYDRCIAPSYPVILSAFTADVETTLKRLQDPSKFKVLIASATAAAHKAYHQPSWRVIAKICRSWAGELAASIIELRDADAVEALMLLLVYELADPEKCIVFELLDAATRICLELGWHRIEKIDESDNASQEHTGDFPDNLNDCDKRRLMSVLRSTDRQLRLVFQRPSMLSGCQSTSKPNNVIVFELYMGIASTVSCIRPNPETCTFSGHLLSQLTVLDQFSWEDPLVQECWLLTLPAFFAHSRSTGCYTQPCSTTIPLFQFKVLQAAVSVLDATHLAMTSSETFMPPFIASSKTFSAGCTLVTGIKENWNGAEKVTGSLLKCSEVLSFSAQLWRGGRDYYEVWRKIVAIV